MHKATKAKAQDYQGCEVMQNSVTVWVKGCTLLGFSEDCNAKSHHPVTSEADTHVSNLPEILIQILYVAGKA